MPGSFRWTTALTVILVYLSFDTRDCGMDMVCYFSPQPLAHDPVGLKFGGKHLLFPSTLLEVSKGQEN